MSLTRSGRAILHASYWYGAKPRSLDTRSSCCCQFPNKKILSSYSYYSYKTTTVLNLVLRYIIERTPFNSFKLGTKRQQEGPALPCPSGMWSFLPFFLFLFLS